MSHAFSPFTLTVTDLNRRAYKVYCLGHDHSVEFIKFALGQQIGIDRNMIHLVKNSQNLSDHQTFRDCNIDRHSKITMVIGLQTGRSLG
jgi:hypothetical protein